MRVIVKRELKEFQFQSIVITCRHRFARVAPLPWGIAWPTLLLRSKNEAIPRYSEHACRRRALGARGFYWNFGFRPAGKQTRSRVKCW